MQGNYLVAGAFGSSPALQGVGGENHMTPRVISALLTAISALLITAFMIPFNGCGGTESLGTRIPFQKGELYYTSLVTPDEATAVGKILVKEGYLNDKKPATIQFTKGNRVYQVRLVVRVGVEDDENCTMPFRKLGLLISRDALESAPVEIHLCDEHLKTVKVIPCSPMKPELPVIVTFRNSIGGSSLVAQYRNTSGRHLTVSLSLRNPTLKEYKNVALDIRPYGTTEHGWAEGWKYVSGEVITIIHADYETAKITVP
jgi:hypothetical protein